jgi:hypothetical protein
MNTNRTITRRRAFRFVAGATLSALATTRLGGEAAATRGWCRADPLLRIAGQEAHVYITSSRAMLSSATDKIVLNVTLPQGVEGKLIDILSDFGDGYRVRFYTSSTLQVVDGQIPVVLAAWCPARDATLPVSVEFAPVGVGRLTSGANSGTANAWIAVSAG